VVVIWFLVSCGDARNDFFCGGGKNQIIEVPAHDGSHPYGRSYRDYTCDVK